MMGVGGLNDVRDASHELQTLVTVLRGHAELIHLAGGETAEDASVILTKLERLARISDRLLLLSAAEHPLFLRCAPVEVERVVVGAVRRWAVVAEREWVVDSTVEGVVLADEDRLSAALDALIENAVDFTADGDRIGISAWSDASEAVVEVADAGKGIAHEHLVRIFDRFARVEREVTRTGLGLAVVKTVAEAHGGSVEVKSVPDGGTSFRLRLPLVPS
jgi:signal transduction histidine kinase